jgi:hypothetical protein
MLDLNFQPRSSPRHAGQNVQTTEITRTDIGRIGMGLQMESWTRVCRAYIRHMFFFYILVLLDETSFLALMGKIAISHKIYIFLYLININVLVSFIPYR